MGSQSKTRFSDCTTKGNNNNLRHLSDMKYIRMISFTPNPMLSSCMLLQAPDSSSASPRPGMYTHTHTRAHTCTCACTHACVHTHVCTHMHTHYTHMHARTHTHTHTHTHTGRISFITLCPKGAGLLRITSQMK